MPKDSERIAAGAEARAGAERGRRVEGRAENYGARLVPRAFAAYEALYRAFHLPLVFQLQSLLDVVRQHEGADVYSGVVVLRFEAERVPRIRVEVFDWSYFFEAKPKSQCPEGYVGMCAW